MAALGRCDALVFTGGIGEHSAIVRGTVGSGLAGLGIVVDVERNNRNAEVVSTDDSPITVLVVPTDEERVIAEQTAALAGVFGG